MNAQRWPERYGPIEEDPLVSGATITECDACHGQNRACVLLLNNRLCRHCLYAAWSAAETAHRT